jgi:glycosyltransferase involved in cell wall biosynthesis
MRIVVDLQPAQNLSAVRGAGRLCATMTQEMCKLANERGHEMLMLVSDRFPDAIPGLIEQFDGLVAPSAFRTFAVPPGAIQETVVENVGRLRVAEVMRENFIASLEPDFVHIHNLFEGSADDAVTSIGRGKSKVPTAVTLLDIIPFVLSDIYITTDEFRNYYESKLRSLREADLLLSISEHSKRDAVKHIGIDASRIVTVSLGVESKFRPADKKQVRSAPSKYGISKPFILYVPGGFDPRKNFGNLLKAYASLPPAMIHDYQLVVASKATAEEQTALFNAAAALGIPSGAFILTGYVPDEDLIALYSLCALNVFPSLYEGFGLPALEAMACGAPTIGSNTSSLPEVIGTPAGLFDPRSPESISAKISAMLTDDVLLQMLREHALSHTRRFSWQDAARKALDAIEVTHRHGAHA